MNAAQRLMAAVVMAAGTVVAVVAWTGAEQPDPWAPTSSASQDAVKLYQQGLDATHASDYAKALELFEKALAKDKDNADILTMTAFCQRHVGKLELAFATYAKALTLKPRHAKAREYLGEAHLQALLAELQTLQGYGDEGKKEAEDLSKALKDAAAKL